MASNKSTSNERHTQHGIDQGGTPREVPVTGSMEANGVSERVEAVTEEVKPLKPTNDAEDNGPDSQLQVALQHGDHKECESDEGVPT